MKQHVWIFLGIIGLVACTSSPKEQQGEGGKPPEEESVVEKTNDKIIMVFGNSITAGYGVSSDQAFPAVVQEIIDSLDYPYKVVNAGLSGETSAGGLNRIEWVLRTVPDIFILELGGNDGLRGLKLSETKKNLAEIVKKVRDKNPEVKIIIAGMEVPPNLGQDYTAEFRNLFKELAEENDVLLIPFLLINVGGEEDLNQSDGIHPNEEGHKLVAQTVWEYLKPLLNKNISGEGI
ncbi:MAG: arylesterase [Bacteroidota bacterium]